MSYRCDVCNTHCPPSKPKLRHTINRIIGPRTEVARELAVCAGCKAALDRGVTLAFLIQTAQRRQAEEARLPRRQLPRVHTPPPAVDGLQPVNLGGLGRKPKIGG